MSDEPRNDATYEDTGSEENLPLEDEESGGKPFRSRVKDAANNLARGISTSGRNVSSVVRHSLVARNHVLMVRINDEALQRINDLKDAGLFKSRSEAAAYLIAEGIASREELFEQIQDRIHQIQQIKDELRNLAENNLGRGEEDDGQEEKK